MGTYVSIAVYDEGYTNTQLTAGIGRAFQAIDSIDTKASRQKPMSELNRCNRSAGKNWFPLSGQLYRIIHRGILIAASSGGAFDPTIAPILDLWGFGDENPRKPGDGEIEERLPLVGYQQVFLDSPRVKFAASGMALDLGGIAKGSAIDAAYHQLMRAGFRDFMVDAGGDLALHSSSLTRGKIRVWIRHPRKSGALFGYFFLDHGFVATSGDYEQFFEENNVRYHHIINPGTGYPDSDLMSVTVLAATAERADAYATAIFVMGWDRGISFARSHPGLQVVLLARVDNKIRYWASDSLMEKITVVDDSLE